VNPKSPKGRKKGLKDVEEEQVSRQRYNLKDTLLLVIKTK